MKFKVGDKVVNHAVFSKHDGEVGKILNGYATNRENIYTVEYNDGSVEISYENKLKSLFQLIK